MLHGGVERRDLTAGFERRGQGEDRFRRPLGDEQTTTRAIRRLHHHRKAAPLEIERDLVELSIARDVNRRLQKNRGIKRTADPGLESAVDVGQRQRPWRCRAPRIERPIELHRPGRQSARLVATENVDAAEVLNGREMFDDHLGTRHPQRSLGQRDGADHGKKFRREADPQGDGKQ